MIKSELMVFIFKFCYFLLSFWVLTLCQTLVSRSHSFSHHTVQFLKPSLPLLPQQQIPTAPRGMTILPQSVGDPVSKVQGRTFLEVYQYAQWLKIVSHTTKYMCSRGTQQQYWNKSVNSQVLLFPLGRWTHEILLLLLLSLEPGAPK